MAGDIRMGDIGTRLTVTVTENGVALNISAATEKLILLKAPGKSAIQKIANFTTNGTDGEIYYDTISGDLSSIGIWQIQAKLTFILGTWSTTIGNFEVKGNL